MSQTQLLILIGVTLLGLVLSALYSGMETGLYTLNRVRVTVRAGRGDKRAMRLRSMLHRSNRTLTTLLIGNNIANYMGTFGIAAILDGMDLSAGTAIALNAGILIPLLFVFGETLPKDLYRTHTDHWSYGTSGLLLISDRLFTILGLAPIVVGFGILVGKMFGSSGEGATSARQRISQLIQEGMGAGVLSETQSTLAERALALHDKTLRSVMVPWSRVASLSADIDLKLRQDIIERRHHTRLPVVAPGGKVMGILSIIDILLAPDQPTRELTKAATEFPPDAKLHLALRMLRQEHRTMAIIVDPKTGNPLGLVTLKDLVEPLTGDLPNW
ncbi:MAG: CNNM domain-containing protein [Planctomycetota bacterium]|nr:CNNM domain-containing protein [Planctomycetota bacterium]